MCDNKNDTSENNDKEKELGCLDDTFPDNMEEGVSDKKNDNSENNDERKDSECLDDRKNNKNEKYDEGEMKVKQQIPRAPQWMNVKE